MPIKLELPLSSVSNVEQSEKLSGVKCAEHTNNFELKLFSILLKIKININHAHSQYGSLRRIWEVPTSSSQPGMVHFCHFRCRDGKLNSVYRLKFFLSHSLNRSVLTSPLSPGGGGYWSFRGCRGWITWGSVCYTEIIQVIRRVECIRCLVLAVGVGLKGSRLTEDADSLLPIDSLSPVPSKTARNLCVIIDDQLTFTDHIASVSRSWCFAIFNIHKIRPHLTQRATQLLVQTWWVPALTTATPLLTGLPECVEKPLQMIQNAAARLVFNQSKRAQVTPLLI